jgi:hypothetical protein
VPGLPQGRAGFDSSPIHVGLCSTNWHLIVSEYLGFTMTASFHHLSTLIHSYIRDAIQDVHEIDPSIVQNKEKF